jgi:beta/gamma crystallin
MVNHRLSLARTGVSLSVVYAALMFAAPPANAQTRRGNTNGVVVYTDPNFNGKSTVFTTDVTDLRPSGLNDQISSIQIPNGQQWEICQDVNFQSRCQTLTSSVADLRTIGWDDSISSLRRVDNGYTSNGSGNNSGYANGNNAYGNNNGYANGNNGYGNDNGYANNGNNNNGYRNNRRGSSQEALVFYNRTGFRGQSTVITYDGYNNVQSQRNGAAGSVQVRSGAWQLCDNSGRCAVVTADVSDLSKLGLRGQITSIRPADNSRGNRRDQNQRGGYENGGR